MSDSTNSSVAAGWYPDPASGDRVRWWDGTKWTDTFQQAYTQDAATLKAPEGTKSYNLWIWLVVLVPYVTLPFLFLLDFSGMFANIATTDPSQALAAQLAIYTSPAFIGLLVGGIVTSVLTVIFGYLDWKSQVAAGVPKPFHWAFIFFNLAGYPVYAIGRSVVTKRRTGHGSAVMWVTIGMIVLTFVVVIIWTVALTTQAINSVGFPTN